MTGSCWMWKGHYVSGGYGRGWSARHQRNMMAHRLVYEELVGPIAKGMTLDHLCRVRGCVNPSHLRAVSIYDNTFAPHSKATAKIHAEKQACPRGHIYDGVYKGTDGTRHHRYCRACRTALQRERRARISASGKVPPKSAATLGSSGAVISGISLLGASEEGRQ